MRIQEEALSHVASNVAHVLAEVKRVNGVLQNFVMTLHGKAATYIERGLQREEKPHRLRSSHHQALQMTQTTAAAQSVAVVACRLPAALTRLEAAQQGATKEELDLRGLPLDRLSVGLAAVRKFDTALASISEVVEAPAEAETAVHLRTIGKEGSGNGEFNYPCGVAVSGGMLYVAESSNHRVQVFNRRPKSLCALSARTSAALVSPTHTVWQCVTACSTSPTGATAACRCSTRRPRGSRTSSAR
jgi:hypothetical protein